MVTLLLVPRDEVGCASRSMSTRPRACRSNLFVWDRAEPGLLLDSLGADLGSCCLCVGPSHFLREIRRWHVPRIVCLA